MILSLRMEKYPVRINQTVQSNDRIRKYFNKKCLNSGLFPMQW